MNPGDYVIDVDDDEPNLAVVLHHSETSIAEWTIDPSGGEKRTVAADNPDYDESEPVVVIAFVESGLNGHWPEWTNVDADQLYEGAQEAGVKLYHFPESRLRVLDEHEVAQFMAEETVDIEALKQRLDDAGWQTELTDGELNVEKMGEEYHIYLTGEIDGEGRVREPLENLVEEYSG